jgi:ribosomal 30S subunit maturation factor RimM
MEKNRLKDIGVVAKPRGIKGGVIIRLDTPVTEEIENAESLFLLVEGRAVPFIADSVTPFGSEAVVVVFRWYDTPAKISGFQGCRVLIESAEETSSILPGHKSLIGFSVLDEHGAFRGRIVSVEEQKHQWLATLAKEEGTSFLVPVHEDLICSLDIEGRIIVMFLPEGIEDPG